MKALVFLRSIHIGWRVAMVATVPTLALLLAVVLQVDDNRMAAESAETELRRMEVLDVLSGIQASNVFPELSDASQRFPIDASVMTEQISLTMWELSLARFTTAEEARARLAEVPPSPTSASGRDLPAEVRTAFDAQHAAVEDLLVAHAEGRAPAQEQIERARQARADADLALTDLALSATSDAWIVHVARVDAVRASWIEFVYLAPALIGLDGADPDELAVLRGQRIQATERVVSVVPNPLRKEIESVLDSPAYDQWAVASEAAPAVAEGNVAPWNVLSVSVVSMNALGLAVEIDSIAATAVDATRVEVAGTAADARSARNKLLVFVGLLVSATAGLTVALLRSVVRPIQILTRHAASIARGERQLRPVAVGGRDELTELGIVLDSVADGLQHLDRQVEAIAEGRLDDPSLGIAAPGPVGARVQSRLEDLREASDALRVHAGTDPLTGLLNRRGLLAALQDDQQDRRPRLVIYIDLDRFKAVNDGHGHKHGDAVLVAVAERLRSLLRPDDLASRLGGDEFILVVDEPDRPLLNGFLARIESMVAEPVLVEGSMHRVGCSIGVSTLDEHADLGNELDRALDEADRRMLRNKTQRHSKPYPQRA